MPLPDREYDAVTAPGDLGDLRERALAVLTSAGLAYLVDLVAWRDGKPFTVKYDQVDMMLLNEFLKAHKKVQDLEVTVAQQQKGMEVLTAQLKEQAAQIQKVSAQIEMSKPAPQVVTNKP